MRFRLDGRSYRGRAVDLRGVDATPEAVRDAVGLAATDPLAVVTPDPVALGPLLAAAARLRGLTAPQDVRVAALTAEVRDDERPPTPDLSAARERAASAGVAVERLRERAATLRGRLQAVREADGDPAPVEAALANATRELTDAETECVAAEQALAAASRRARDRRDAAERALRVRDALENRRREARAHLARRLYPAFAAAARRLPGEASPGDRPGAFEGDPATARLAAVAVADRTAPVVLAVRRFGGPSEAATRLDAPVVQL